MSAPAWKAKADAKRAEDLVKFALMKKDPILYARYEVIKERWLAYVTAKQDLVLEYDAICTLMQDFLTDQGVLDFVTYVKPHQMLNARKTCEALMDQNKLTPDQLEKKIGIDWAKTVKKHILIVKGHEIYSEVAASIRDVKAAADEGDAE